MGNACCEEQNRPYDQKNKTTIPVRKITNNLSQNNKTDNYSVTISNNSNLKSKGMQQQIRNKQQSNSPKLQMDFQPGLAKHGPENYQSIKYLGKGTFGDVVLAQDKENGKQYAMKIIQKKKIKQLILLQSELIKKISQHELFVKIRQTFQNESKIYIVMEYIPKGDIYFYLKKKTFVFRQDIIKMMVAEIIVGIQYLHSQGVIYRELKPQNIFVTNQGHIKLGDYGLSKVVYDKGPTSTFIGTLEYIAPQALQGNYDKKADIWAIGVLMYELKFQKNLFEAGPSQTVEKIQQKITLTNVQQIVNAIIGKVGYDFRDVLIKLLQVDPEKRICLEELKKHPFFDGIVWQDIPLRKNPPPLRQILESDHIKFKDPNNYTQLAHRKRIQNKTKEFQTKLYQFRDE